MGEVSAAAIESVLGDLDCIMGQAPGDVPGWVAQELTFGQMRLLFLLGKHGPSPVSRIAEWLGVGLPAASGVIDRIERHGLLERRHREDDRRIVECSLTTAGLTLLEEIAGMRRHVLAETLGVLSTDELADLARLVSLLRQRMATR